MPAGIGSQCPNCSSWLVAHRLKRRRLPAIIAATRRRSPITVRLRRGRPARGFGPRRRTRGGAKLGRTAAGARRRVDDQRHDDSASAADRPRARHGAARGRCADRHSDHRQGPSLPASDPGRRGRCRSTAWAAAICAPPSARFSSFTRWPAGRVASETRPRADPDPPARAPGDAGAGHGRQGQLPARSSWRSGATPGCRPSAVWAALILAGRDAERVKARRGRWPWQRPRPGRPVVGAGAGPIGLLRGRWRERLLVRADAGSICPPGCAPGCSRSACRAPWPYRSTWIPTDFCRGPTCPAWIERCIQVPQGSRWKAADRRVLMPAAMSSRAARIRGSVAAPGVGRDHQRHEIKARTRRFPTVPDEANSEAPTRTIIGVRRPRSGRQCRKPARLATPGAACYSARANGKGGCRSAMGPAPGYALASVREV